jgi:hypothetical protein
VSSAQLIHISTAIHSRGIRPDWRGLARQGKAVAASFVHNIGPVSFFADDDWLKSPGHARSAHFAGANEALTLK